MKACSSIQIDAVVTTFLLQAQEVLKYHQHSFRSRPKKYQRTTNIPSKNSLPAAAADAVLRLKLIIVVKRSLVLHI